MSTEIRAFDMSRYQRLIATDGGQVTGTFKVSPPSRPDRETWVIPIDVVLWDEYRSGGMILYSDDMTCAVRDGVAELCTYNTSKEAIIKDAWPDIKLAVEAVAAVFTQPDPPRPDSETR